MKYQEIDGDLIKLALAGEFDVIAHGCNCFCLQKAGIAAQMSKTFNTSDYYLESSMYIGDINKLGQIECETDYIEDTEGYTTDKKITVINAYTQYQPGVNLDYEALTLCLRKMNHTFKGKHIGLPQIGCGIAGGVWDKNLLEYPETDFYRDRDVKTIIQQELKDCNVTIVIYNK